MTPRRALVLLSGGLDSALAARLVLDQEVEVIGLHLESPTACRSDVREVASELGIALEVRAKGEEYLKLLRHPRWGYGKNMNPCIDCRMYMFRVAREFMDRLGARFLVTGEVAGQRPMSQSKNTMALIDREADLEGWVLRPLSALLLSETEPERRRWVDRSRLLGISGRGRTEQLELASRYGLAHYQSPGGGCLLTDAHFSAKLRDLLDHLPEDRTAMSDVALLRLGRHFRVRDDLKVVLGRNQEENRRLHDFQTAERWLVEPHGFNGPTALVCGPRDEEGLSAALRLMAEYTREARPELEVRWRDQGALRTRSLLSIAPVARALALAATCLLGPSAAGAQSSPAPPPTVQVSAFADTSRPALFLEETVITGARYPRAYYESPQALSFLSRSQLRERVPTVLGDALSILPGLDNSKDSPWEQRPVLRGLGGQRVLVLVDGMPMNSARGNGPHPSLVDPDQVERIEVVRGPSSVAYGSDALGGVINIITREAPLAAADRFRGSATVSGSSADAQRNATLELMPRLGRLSAFLSSGFRKAENFHSPDGEVPNSGFRDYNALSNFRYDLTDRTALKLGWQLYRGSDIGIPGLSFEFPGARQEFDFSFYDRDLVHFTLDRATRGSWLEGTRVKLYWQQERRDFFSEQVLDSAMFASFGVPPRSGATSATTLQDRYLDLDTYGFQAQLTSARMSRIRLAAGVDASRDMTDGDNVRRRTYYDASGNPVPGPGGSPATARRITASLPDGRFDNYGIFAQWEWYLDSRSTLHAGGRFTHYRYRTDFGLNAPASGAPGSQDVYFQPMRVDDDALSGSLGLVHEVFSDFHISANVSNGYRQPNAQDLFFNGPASVGNVLGNQNLDPERSVSYDAGLRWGPGRLGLAANLFYSTYEDLIDALPVPGPPGPPTYQYTNISEARIWGWEAEAEWRLLPQWSARAAVSNATGDITSPRAIESIYGVSDVDEAPLPSVPPIRGAFALRWSDARNRFWFEPAARWSWRTSRLPLPTPGVPEFTEFKPEWIVGDLFAGAKLPWGQRLVLGVRNLADTRYRQALASVDDPGINVVGSLGADF